MNPAHQTEAEANLATLKSQLELAKLEERAIRKIADEKSREHEEAQRRKRTDTRPNQRN
jgi:hypothetical protein